MKKTNTLMIKSQICKEQLIEFLLFVYAIPSLLVSADVNFSSHWVNETGDEAARFKGSHSMPDLFPDDYWINDITYVRKIFNPNTDVWNPLIAAFSSPGMKQRRRWRQKGRYRTGEVRPKGAICQFQ